MMQATYPGAVRPPAAMRGFSLVELMIALLIGLIVVGSAGSIYMANRRAYAATEVLGRVQESSRVAFELMARDIREADARANLIVGRVGVGDPRSRWGSCTHDGDLRYSWRLVMAPDHVRRATVAHEVAHLRHMDHSAAFHALVDDLHDGDVGAARAWLRREGRGLHRYRFT